MADNFIKIENESKVVQEYLKTGGTIYELVSWKKTAQSDIDTNKADLNKIKNNLQTDRLTFTIEDGTILIDII